MKKQFSIISVFLFCTFVYTTFAYTDISETSPSFRSFMYLVNKDIVRGYPDNTLRPDRPVNRAEMSKMLVKLFPISKQKITINPLFEDVVKTDWYFSYVLELFHSGSISGYSGGKTFHPDYHVTRAEALKMTLLRAGVSENTLEHTLKGYLSVYPNVSYVFATDVQTKDWFASYVAYAFSNNIIRSTLFRPNEKMTRAEAVMLLTDVEVYLKNQKSFVHTPTITKESTLLEFEQLKKDFKVVLKNNEDDFVWNTNNLPTSIPKQPFVVPPVPPTTQNIFIKNCTYSDQTNCTTEEKTFFSTGKITIGNLSIIFSNKVAEMIIAPNKFINNIQRVQDSYIEIFGLRPYQNQEIISLCSWKEGITFENHRTVTDNNCPLGYIWFNAWGLSGNPIEITNDAGSQVAKENNNGYLTFGIAHELAHTFENVTPNTQYYFDSSSREAIANLWLLLGLDRSHVPIQLDNKTFWSSTDLLAFYSPFYAEYTSKGYSFQNLFVDNPIAGNLADYYLGVILARLDTITLSDLKNVFRLYVSQGNNIRSIDADDRIGRMNQFVYFLSCVSGKDLSFAFEKDRFPMLPITKQNIPRCLKSDIDYKTIVDLDS